MNIVSKLICFLIVFLISSPSLSKEFNVIYINGVGNSKDAADESLAAIKKILDESVNHQNDKISFNSDNVWNPIGFTGKTLFQRDSIQDYQELFLLKTAEEWYTPALKAIISPHHNLNQNIDKEAAKIVDIYFKDMTPQFNSLVDDGYVDDDDMEATSNAITELISKITKNGIEANIPTIIVAHSQGNLLANLAYAHLASIHGSDLNKYLRVVNIANTSIFSVSDLNITHNDDRALITLMETPLQMFEGLSRELSTRETLICSGVCRFNIAEPTFSGADVSGLTKHGIVKTYLSSTLLPTPESDQKIDFTDGKISFRDRFEDFVYAAANSFEDDDLHTSAPPVSITPTNVPEGCAALPRKTKGQVTIHKYDGAGSNQHYNLTTEVVDITDTSMKIIEKRSNNSSFYLEEDYNFYISNNYLYTTNVLARHPLYDGGFLLNRHYKLEYSPELKEPVNFVCKDQEWETDAYLREDVYDNTTNELIDTLRVPRGYKETVLDINIQITVTAGTFNTVLIRKRSTYGSVSYVYSWIDTQTGVIVSSKLTFSSTTPHPSPSISSPNHFESTLELISIQ